MSKSTIAKWALGGALAIATPFVASFEGSSLQAYLDPVGIPTICSGITAGVKLGDSKSPAECDALLQAELTKAMQVVDRLVTVPMPETRRAALASFVYNAGPNSFANSTLLRRLNSGDTYGACNELLRWVYAKGTKLNGLVRRRAAERELCLQGL